MYPIDKNKICYYAEHNNVIFFSSELMLTRYVKHRLLLFVYQILFLLKSNAFFLMFFSIFFVFGKIGK